MAKKTTLRVLVCGDRAWSDPRPIRRELRGLPVGTTVVVGGAPGADTLAQIEAQALGLHTEVFMARWKEFGRAAGPIRNQAMLDSGIDVVLAFHRDLSVSKGTADMVRRALKKPGVEVHVLKR